MNGITATLTELREAIIDYKAYIETGVRGMAPFYRDPGDGSGSIPVGEVECFSISGGAAVQQLNQHHIRLDKAVAAARDYQSLHPALDALLGGCYGFHTWDSTVNPAGIAEAHRAQVMGRESSPWCRYVRADLLNALDRMLARLPSPPPDDLITVAVAVNDYHVTDKTLQRAREVGRITGYRSMSAAPNAAYKYSRAEIAKRYARKS